VNGRASGSLESRIRSQNEPQLPRYRAVIVNLDTFAGLLVLVLTPITVEAGEYLQSVVGTTPALALHVERGEGLLPWSIALFVVGLAEWGWWRFLLAPQAGVRLTSSLRWGGTVVLWLAAAIVGIGFIVEIVLIGDSGARAVWGGLHL
jgi:hypothetical protein